MKENQRILPSLISSLELLDSRILPSAVGMSHVVPTAISPHVAVATATTSTTTNMGDLKNGPLAKAGQTLIALYQGFVAQGSVSPSLAATVHIAGANVGVDIRGTGSVSALAAALTNLGMKVQMTDARTVTVEGSIPISQIPAAAQLAQVISMNPIFKPPVGPPTRISG